MKKRTSLFVILLSALLMVSMMSAMAFAKDKKEAPENGKTENHALKEGGFSVKDLSAPLYVGGVEVQATTTKTEIENACTSGKAYVQFNSDGTAATLWLDGAEISGFDEFSANIRSESIDLTIVLIGDNVVRGTDSLADYAVYVKRPLGVTEGGSLTIQGSGKLTAEGRNSAIYTVADCKIESGEIKATSTGNAEPPIGHDAIYAGEDINITGGTVTATVANGTKDADAICAGNDIVISGASVKAEAGCVEGAQGCRAIWADNVDISGSTVKAELKSDVSSLKDCNAICADATKVSITDSEVTATVTGGYDGCDAICAKKGAVDISASKVTASTDDGDAISGNNVSILKGSAVDVTTTASEEAILANGGDITIDSSDVKANSWNTAFDCRNATVKNSSVSAKGKWYAVRANGIISIENSILKNTEGEIYAEEDLRIQDSRINVTSDYIALNADAIDIKNTEKGYSTYVDAEVHKLDLSGLSTNEAGSNYAVRASENSLNINDLGITLPVNGKIGNYEESFEEHTFKNATIMDGDKPAMHVIIEAPKHDINVEATPGGKVKVEPEKAAEGEEVKVIATPDEGYEVEKIVVIDADGKETDITARGSFTMGKTNVKVRVTFRKKAAPAAKPVAAVKGIAKGQTSLKFTWKKVKGATKYEIWMSRCNTSKKKYSVKKVKTLGASKTTWTKKNLRKNTGYKFRVVAKDASGKVICKSVICHSYTGNVWSKYTNVKSLKVSKSSYTLKKGGKAKIKATQTKVRPDKKLCHHAKMLRYKSNNTSVAKVDKSGRITAVGTGECKVYVQTVNGIWKTVKVSVN